MCTTFQQPRGNCKGIPKKRNGGFYEEMNDREGEGEVELANISYKIGK